MVNKKIFIWEYESILDFDIFDDIGDTYATGYMISVGDDVAEAREKLINRLEKDKSTTKILIYGNLEKRYLDIINSNPTIIIPIEDAYISDTTIQINNIDDKIDEVDLLKEEIEKLDEEEIYGSQEF